MLNRFFINKRSLTIVAVILSSMQAATSPTQNIDSVELNWLKSGTHNLPGCHGSITLTENMLGLGKNDIPQELMKEFPDPTAIKAIIFVKQKTGAATIFVANTDTEILNDPQKIDGNSLLKTIKDAVEKKYFSSQNDGKNNIRWFSEPSLQKTTKTVNAIFQYDDNNKTSIYSVSTKLGKHSIVRFEWQAPEAEYQQLKADVEKLVNSFTFEPEYSLPDNTFDGKAISFSIYLYILLGTFLFSILAFICSMVWRKNSKNGNQKLASEMLASFFVALLFYMFKILKNPAIIKKGLPFLLGNCIGECIGTSLLIFFIFFFWSWKKQFIQISPARIIIKTLCIIIMITSSWFTLSSFINFLQTYDLTEFLNSILLIILIVLIARKYMQLFTHQNNQAAEHIERENLETH